MKALCQASKKECRKAFCSVFSVNVDVKFPHVKIKLKGNGLYLLRILFEIGLLPLIACLIVIPICHNCSV